MSTGTRQESSHPANAGFFHLPDTQQHQTGAVRARCKPALGICSLTPTAQTAMPKPQAPHHSQTSTSATGLWSSGRYPASCMPTGARGIPRVLWEAGAVVCSGTVHKSTGCLHDWVPGLMIPATNLPRSVDGNNTVQAVGMALSCESPLGLTPFLS